MRTDVYERITGQIVAELEKGERPWLKPWSAEHAAGRITRPLRHNGIPYQGINVVMLWPISQLARNGAAIEDVVTPEAERALRVAQSVLGEFASQTYNPSFEKY